MISCERWRLETTNDTIHVRFQPRVESYALKSHDHKVDFR